MYLSLLSPSYMVVLIRGLVNTSLSTSTKALSTNLMAQIPANMNMNIDINIPRGRSALHFSKSSRESSIHSNVSSVSYHTRMEIQSNNFLWSKQVKAEKITLSYAINAKEDNIPVEQIVNNSPKIGVQCEINETPALSNTPSP